MRVYIRFIVFISLFCLIIFLVWKFDLFSKIRFKNFFRPSSTLVIEQNTKSEPIYINISEWPHPRFEFYPESKEYKPGLRVNPFVIFAATYLGKQERKMKFSLKYDSGYYHFYLSNYFCGLGSNKPVDCDPQINTPYTIVGFRILRILDKTALTKTFGKPPSEIELSVSSKSKQEILDYLNGLQQSKVGGVEDFSSDLKVTGLVKYEGKK